MYDINTSILQHNPGIHKYVYLIMISFVAIYVKIFHYNKLANNNISLVIMFNQHK